MGNQEKTFFFFDRGLLQPQGMDNCKIRVCKAVKDDKNSPMFTEGRFETPMLPWEARYDNSYPNVIWDDEAQIYRCYYTLCTRDSDSVGVSREERAARPYRPNSGRIASVAYAESRDGVHWVKPNLGLVDFEGSTENNILFRYAHGTGVFLDKEEQNPAKRYKMVTKVEYPYGAYDFMAVNFSPDGIHWGEMIRWPKFNPQADSHNFPFRDPADGKFKLITRVWSNGMRISAVCESTDFINWTEPREIARGNDFADQIYSMPVFRYQGLYIGLASIFHEGDRRDPDYDTVDLEMKYATEVKHFNPVCAGDYTIERGAGHYPDGAFDCGCIYAAAPIEMDDKLCIYYMGGNGQHTNFRETSFGRAFLEKDKLAYITAKDESEYMTVPTSLLALFGEKMEVLCDMEEGGDVQIALYDRWNGSPLPGCDFTDAVWTDAADGYKAVHFGTNLLDLGRAHACVVIKAKKAKLYALRGDLSPLGNRYFGGGIQ